jgi:hypothetical protein
MSMSLRHNEVSITDDPYANIYTGAKMFKLLSWYSTCFYL